MTFLKALGKFHSILCSKSLLSIAAEVASALPTVPWHSLLSYKAPLCLRALSCRSTLAACRAGQESTPLGVHLKQRCSRHMINTPASLNLSWDNSEAYSRQPPRSLQHAPSPGSSQGNGKFSVFASSFFHFPALHRNFLELPSGSIIHTQIFVLGSVSGAIQPKTSTYSVQITFYNMHQET